jgi:hypothetical protein
MSPDTAERWVTISAAVVAGLYAYRRLTEPSAPPATLKKLFGVGELPPVGAWATAWGFTFLVVSVMAEAAPGLGGAFAILIMVGDLMTNSGSVFADVGKQEGSSVTTQTPATTAATAASNLVNIPGGGTAPYQPPAYLNLTTPSTAGAGHQGLG